MRENPLTWLSILQGSSDIKRSSESDVVANNRKSILGHLTSKLKDWVCSCVRHSMLSLTPVQLNVLADSHGLQSVLLMTGNDVIRDNDLGMVFESSESQGVRIVLM